MNIVRNTLVALVLAVLAMVTLALGGVNPDAFSTCVDKKGVISIPRDYRANWVHLGSWAVPARTDPGSGFHDVYTQRETVEYYKKNKKFPDGAVLVKEIREAIWGEMATGHVVYAGDTDTWFVMVKDDKKRFPGNPNWGDGWGWALFKASDPSKNASKDYKKDCIPCHEPAKDTDWVYITGYPTIR